MPVCVDCVVKHTTSADGTEIGYEVHERAAQGGGPTVVCLHGTGVTRQVWGRFLASASGARFVVPDRRGRGASGDASSWAFERELADVVALATAESPDRQVTLFGSSFGGLLSLRAAERLDVDRLALYEPPMPAVTVENSEAVGVADEVDSRLAAGDRQGAVRLFFEEATGASNVEAWPIWPDCVALAETIARECHVVESFDPGELSLSVPTLLFRGEHSLPYLQSGIDLLDDRLQARVVDIEAGHAGVAAAPAQVASAFDEFVAETG